MDTTGDQQRDDRQAASFHRAVWLQVYLPLVLGGVLVAALIAVALAASGRGGATTSGMADMALVALLMPMMLLGVIGLVAIVLLTVGVAWAIGWIPERSRLIQRIAAQASQESDRITRRAAQVIVVPKSAWSAIGALWARRLGKD